MGLHYPPKYRVKRNGEWVTITPPPVELGVQKYDRKAYQDKRKRLKAERNKDHE